MTCSASALPELVELLSCLPTFERRLLAAMALGWILKGSTLPSFGPALAYRICYICYPSDVNAVPLADHALWCARLLHARIQSTVLSKGLRNTCQLRLMIIRGDLLSR